MSSPRGRTSTLQEGGRTKATRGIRQRRDIAEIIGNSRSGFGEWSPSRVRCAGDEGRAKGKILDSVVEDLSKQFLQFDYRYYNVQ